MRSISSRSGFAAALGPAPAYRAADALLAMGVLAGGGFGLRLLSSRRPLFAALEVLRSRGRKVA